MRNYMRDVTPSTPYCALSSNGTHVTRYRQKEPTTITHQRCLICTATSYTATQLKKVCVPSRENMYNVNREYKVEIEHL